MEALKKILSDEDTVDLTPMIGVTFSSAHLLYGYDHAQAAGSRTVHSVARQTAE